MLYHIYYKGQLAGPPLASVSANSEWQALTIFRREQPHAIRADRLEAAAKLR